MFQIKKETPAREVILETENYSEASDLARSMMELEYVSGEESLTHVNITWASIHHIGDKYFVCKPETYTVCNFRRYGWCSAHGKDAREGFRGVTYANRIDGGITCISAEEVIRETFIRQMAEFSARHRPPTELIYGAAEVKQIWDKLVQDAIKHKNDHADNCTFSTNGAIVDHVKVSER